MIRQIKFIAIALIFSGIISCTKDSIVTANVSPTVSLTSPADNSRSATPGSFTITATASDADGSISKVDFYNGATLLGTAATAPYTFSWTNVAEGKYVITAKATDNSGAVTTSSAANVAVDVTFKTTLSAANEVPANASPGTGTSTLILNIDTKIFTVTTTYSGLTGTATAAHIHKAAVGVIGSVIFPFTNVTVSPIVYTSAVIDAAQEADLRAGLWYTNVHTALNPGGEIRGQLIKQ
jgi:hypothetical protein